MSIAALDWAFQTALCPSSSCKLVLLVYANFCNEDGRAYPSTETVARLSGLNAKTVRSAIDALELVDMLHDTGRRVGRTSNVKVYRLALESVPELGALAGEHAPDHSTDAQDAAGETKPATHPISGAFVEGAKAPVSGLKGSQIREAEPSGNPKPLEGAKAPSAPKGEKAGRSKIEWQVPTITDLPPAVRAIAEQWPAGAYEAEAAGHAAWLAGQRRRVNPDLGWHARIVQLGAKPIQAAKAGLRYNPAPAASSSPSTPAAAIARCGTADEGNEAAALRTALAGRFHENLVDRWIAPCRFDFIDDEVRVVAPTPFTLSWLRQNAATLIEFEAAAIIGRSAHVSWEVGVPA